MKKIGNIDISFKNYSDDIYYYNVDIQIGDYRRKIILPRYDTFLGWIEVFGLPPQNEWVVLSGLDNFSKKAILTIDDNEIEESIEYTKGEDAHTIKTSRKTEDIEEVSVWKQNYKNAPESISSEISFEHNEGKYKSEWTTSILSETSTLSTEENSFVAEIESKYGKPGILIKKVFISSGVLPPIYYKLFPIQDVINLSETSGSVIEIGYPRKDSPHKVDNVHGDWYKRFDFGEKKLYINETSYTSRDQETKKGIERIKDNYRKELFVQ